MTSPTEQNVTLVSKIIREAVLKVLSTPSQPVDVSSPIVSIESSTTSSMNKFGQYLKYIYRIRYNISFISISLVGTDDAKALRQNLNKSVTDGTFLSIVQSIALQNYSMSSFANITLPSIKLSEIQTKLGRSEPLSTASGSITPNTSIIIVSVVVVVSVLLICLAVYLLNQKQSKRDDVLVVGEDLLDFGRDYQGTMADVIHSVNDSEVVRQSIDGLDASDVRSSINPLAMNRQDGANTRMSFLNNVISTVSQFASGAIRQPINRAHNSSSASLQVSSSNNVQDLSISNKIALTESATKKKPSPSKPKNLKLVDCKVEQILKILDRLNLSKYKSLFVENNIDGRILNEIATVEDLQSCGIAMPPPVMRALLREITDFQKKGVPDL
jgi:hypothetical protein